MSLRLNSVEASIDRHKTLIAYRPGRHGHVIHNMQKPAQYKRDEIRAVIAKHRVDRSMPRENDI
ncbi:MAG TPA: hypothetical protein VE544_13585 [Nitrososphaeraceae archaeon]|nr:hypothetical protein [Nitrososphaeraceae archaeon]